MDTGERNGEKVTLEAWPEDTCTSKVQTAVQKWRSLANCSIIRAAATRKARSPTVDSRVWPTISDEDGWNEVAVGVHSSVWIQRMVAWPATKGHFFLPYRVWYKNNQVGVKYAQVGEKET